LSLIMLVLGIVIRRVRPAHRVARL
jgi:hypothetical protein